MVEHSAVNRKVAGSIPAWRAASLFLSQVPRISYRRLSLQARRSLKKFHFSLRRFSSFNTAHFDRLKMLSIRLERVFNLLVISFGCPSCLAQKRKSRTFDGIHSWTGIRWFIVGDLEPIEPDNTTLIHLISRHADSTTFFDFFCLLEYLKTQQGYPAFRGLFSTLFSFFSTFDLFLAEKRKF